MAEERIRRRLAAILALDVVGYSRLMAADEAGTYAALVECQKTILEPSVKGHGGRVVKLMGDGALVEFAIVTVLVWMLLAGVLDLGRALASQQILQNAAAGGYHALGLAYVNDEAVNELCPVGGPPECHSDVRVEIITGDDRSELVEVTPADSIDNRLIK